MIRLAVLIEHRLMKDRQTDGQTDGRTVTDGQTERHQTFGYIALHICVAQASCGG